MKRELIGDTKNHRPSDGQNNRQNQIRQLVLGLTAASLLRNPLRDLFGPDATDEENNDGRKNVGNIAQPREFKGDARRQQRKRNDLTRRAHGHTRDGLQKRGPHDGREEHGPEGGHDIVGSPAPLETVVENAHVVPSRARPVLVVVEACAVLAGLDGVDLLASELLFRSDHTSLGDEQDQGDPREDANRRGDEVDVAPGVVDGNPRTQNTKQDNHGTLGGEDGGDGLVALVKKGKVLNNQRDQSLDSARPQSVKHARGNVLYQRLTSTRPEAGHPGQECRQQHDGSSADAHGERDEQVGGHTVAQHGNRGEQGNVGEGDLLGRIGRD